MGTVSLSDLQQMKEVDIRTVDVAGLTDIRDVQVDRALPRGERFMDFVRQIKNPYCFRCGKVAVKVSFADTDVTLEERLEHYLSTL